MKILLAYHQENDNFAQNFTNELKEVNELSFTHAIIQKDNMDTTMAATITNSSQPIIMLISHQFLRSVNCMHNMLKAFQSKADYIIPVFIPSTYQNEQGESETDTPKVDKISDIIKYINFWQDRYISMRQQKNEIEGGDSSAYHDYLKTLREISVEVGEFLRMLRSTTHYSADEFANNDYEVLFDLAQIPSAWEQYKASRKGDQNISVADEIIAGSTEPKEELEEAIISEPKIEETSDRNHTVIESVDDVTDDKNYDMDDAINVDKPSAAIEEIIDIEIKEEDHTKMEEEVEKTTTSDEEGVLDDDNSEIENEKDINSIIEQEEPTTYQAALAAIENGENAESKALLKKVLMDNPEHDFAWYDLALLYHKEGENELAKEAYLKACANNDEVKTKNNDLAFGISNTDEGEASEQEIGLLESEKLTLEALKANIDKLTTLVNKREKQDTEKQVVPRVGDKKICMITGTTSGIGNATAKKFAEAGFNLIITGRRKERLAELKKELQNTYNIEVKSLQFDVRNKEKVFKAIEDLPKKWKDIDILINNAGKAKGLDDIQNGQIEHWEEMIDTNLKGLLYVSKAVIPLMIEKQKGHIINIDSTAGKEVYPKGNVYCATKYGVDALTKGMRIDLHKENIRVSMISPAHVEETEFALVRFDGDADKAKIYEDFQPLKASDVAESILFIATQPAHVNILDIVLQGTQQPSSTIIDRSGRKFDNA